jgi:hypothetical protein
MSTDFGDNNVDMDTTESVSPYGQRVLDRSRRLQNGTCRACDDHAIYEARPKAVSIHACTSKPDTNLMPVNALT